MSSKWINSIRKPIYYICYYLLLSGLAVNCVLIYFFLSVSDKNKLIDCILHNL